MPQLLQAKLLRVMQEKVVRRLGGSKNIPIIVRIILATNKDLLAEVKKGNFREDLYYRINVLNLKIPPLRDRKEDIPLIAESIMHKMNGSKDSSVHISLEQWEQLKSYNWYGNVRELFNFIERLRALSTENIVTDETIRCTLHDIIGMHPTVSQSNIQSHENNEKLTIAIDSMEKMEKAIIRYLYDRFSGDKKKVESVLGMSHTTLWRRFKEISDCVYKL